jgi:hypothetical protein
VHLLGSSAVQYIECERCGDDSKINETPLHHTSFSMAVSFPQPDVAIEALY